MQQQCVWEQIRTSSRGVAIPRKNQIRPCLDEWNSSLTPVPLRHDTDRASSSEWHRGWLYPRRWTTEWMAQHGGLWDCETNVRFAILLRSMYFSDRSVKRATQSWFSVFAIHFLSVFSVSDFRLFSIWDYLAVFLLGHSLTVLQSGIWQFGLTVLQTGIWQITEYHRTTNHTYRCRI